MNHSLINAAISMQALQQKLDVLAHNIANVNTAGYKRRDASFQDILTSVSKQPEPFDRNGRLTPLGLPQGWGAKLGQVELNLAQGVLKETGGSLDLAIEGNGMFEVLTDSVDSNGNPTIAWTRDGTFELSAIPGNTQALYLTTQDGHRVVGTNGQPIVVPVNADISVLEDGRIFTRAPAGSRQISYTPEFVGQIKLMRVNRPQVLVNEGNNLYKLPEGLEGFKDEVMTPADLAADQADGQSKVVIRQGFLEQSNVNLTEEMTELMTLQRAYQMNARAITSSDTLMSLANNLRA